MKPSNPRLSTERLLLRPMVPSDYDPLFRFFTTPEVMAHIFTRDTRTAEQTRKCLDACVAHWKEHGFGFFAVVEKDSDLMVGYSGFKCFAGTSEIELGYLYNKHSWGKGYATEAAWECLRYGFAALDFEKVIATVQPANKGSQRVLTKLGMTHTHNGTDNGVDLYFYTIRRADFPPPKET